MTDCTSCGEQLSAAEALAPSGQAGAACIGVVFDDATGKDVDCTGPYCAKCAPSACQSCGLDACLSHRVAGGCADCAAAGTPGELCHNCAQLQIGTTGGGLNSAILCPVHLAPEAQLEKIHQVVTACPLESVSEDETHFDCWTPAIRLETFKALGDDGHRPFARGQREHPIPNSCFLRIARRMPPCDRAQFPQNDGYDPDAFVKGAEKYREGDVMCYWVQDGQKQGYEHKFLTDHERSFSNMLEARGAAGTLGMWLAFIELKTRASLVRLASGGPGGARTHAGCKDGLSGEECAAKTAEAMRSKVSRHYVEEMKIPLDTKLRNGLSSSTKTRTDTYDAVLNDPAPTLLVDLSQAHGRPAAPGAGASSSSAAAQAAAAAPQAGNRRRVALKRRRERPAPGDAAIFSSAKAPRPTIDPSKKRSRSSPAAATGTQASAPTQPAAPTHTAKRARTGAPPASQPAQAAATSSQAAATSSQAAAGAAPSPQDRRRRRVTRGKNKRGRR